MALVVENGTGLPTANTYISIADADTYHGDRGNTAWADAIISAKEAALIKATQWLDGMYRKRWLGKRLTAVQMLGWPRAGAVDHEGYELPSHEVPIRVGYAVAEVALLVVVGQDINPVLERGGRIKREKIGPIETEFADGAPAREEFTIVSDLLRGLVRGPGLRITR